MAKAEPLSDGGGAAGGTRFVRGESCCPAAPAAGERSGVCESSSPAAPGPGQGEAGGLQAPQQRLPQPAGRPPAGRAVPPARGAPGGAAPPPQPGQGPPRGRGCPQGAVTRGQRRWGSSWQGPWPRGERSPGWGPRGDPPGAGWAWGAAPWEGPGLGQGQGARSLPVGGRGGRDSCEGLTPASARPGAAGGAGGRDTGSGAEPGRREGRGEGGLRCRFYFSLSYSDLIGTKLN